MSFNYQNGLIYKIVSNNPDIKDCYVGSSTNFKQRKADHKKNCNSEKSKKYNLNVYKFIRDNGGWENWSMVQIEPYPCNTKRELESRERHHFEQLNANLNSQNPSRTPKEYKQDNREAILAQKKQYRQDNRDTILAYMKQYKKDKKEMRTCVCGSTYNYGFSANRNEHFSSKKHNNYVAAIHDHLRELISQ